MLLLSIGFQYTKRLAIPPSYPSFVLKDSVEGIKGLPLIREIYVRCIGSLLSLSGSLRLKVNRLSPNTVDNSTIFINLRQIFIGLKYREKKEINIPCIISQVLFRVDKNDD